MLPSKDIIPIYSDDIDIRARHSIYIYMARKHVRNPRINMNIMHVIANIEKGELTLHNIALKKVGFVYIHSGHLS